MSRGVIYLVICILVVAVGVLGYMYYDARNRHGLEIKVGQVDGPRFWTTERLAINN